jgi:hypothetical protein
VQAKIHHIVALMWADNMMARQLDCNGKYQWIRPFTHDASANNEAHKATIAPIFRVSPQQRAA